jgi:hypothetical protein
MDFYNSKFRDFLSLAFIIIRLFSSLSDKIFPFFLFCCITEHHSTEKRLDYALIILLKTAAIYRRTIELCSQNSPSAGAFEIFNFV